MCQPSGALALDELLPADLVDLSERVAARVGELDLPVGSGASPPLALRLPACSSCELLGRAGCPRQRHVVHQHSRRIALGALRLRNEVGVPVPDLAPREQGLGRF